VTSPLRLAPRRHRRSHIHPMGITAASSRRTAVSRCRPCLPGPGGRPD